MVGRSGSGVSRPIDLSLSTIPKRLFRRYAIPASGWISSRLCRRFATGSPGTAIPWNGTTSPLSPCRRSTTGGRNKSTTRLETWSGVRRRKASRLERWSSTTRWCGAFRRYTTNRPFVRVNRSGTIKKVSMLSAGRTRPLSIAASSSPRRWRIGVIGFAKLVPDEDHQQAALMQILSMVSHRDKSPTNALIAQAVRSCAERRNPVPRLRELCVRQ